MATFTWAASGSQGTWTDAIAAASLSALANNSMVVGAAIDNTSTLAEVLELSFISTAAAIAVTAGGHLAPYVLPLLHDGTSYPTNSASGTSLPSVIYAAPNVIGVPTGTVVPTGSVLVPCRFGTFKIALVNRLGIALPTSTTAFTLRYRFIYDTVA